MLWLELLMVLIGLVAVFVSFRLSDRQERKPESGDPIDSESAVAESLERQEKYIDDLFEKFRRQVDDLVEETDENLGHLSNEKIMSLSEFSEQTLEKIQKNHDDVVFLYDMIEEKQQELKKLVHDVDLMRVNLQDEAAAEYQQIKEKQDRLDSLKKDIELEALHVEANLKQSKGAVDDELHILSGEETQEPMPAEGSVYDAEIARIEEQEALNSDTANHNGEIISLYKKGRSVLEISKMLSLGQGEVKFVIDLYNAS